VLKILHTADLHLGLEFGLLTAEDGRKLSRARLDVVRTILSVADLHAVDVVLWAGDVFDTPEPAEDWWRGLAGIFRSQRHWSRPVVLLPGNHDPIKAQSVFHRDHPFRSLLPEWVHVVESGRFELPVGDDAVILAAPCQTTAGAEDLALSLPTRAEGDTRIRVGLVHGSTFDIEGHQTNFPIARDAPEQRGLDYLAVGDTHGHRVIAGPGPAPIVYPGAPEQARFGETDTGSVAVVLIPRAGARPTIIPERVGRWTWRDETVTSLPALRRLASEDLSTTVLRLRFDMTIPVTDEKEVGELIRQLRGDLASTGRAGALVVDRSGLRVEVGALEDVMSGAPETLAIVANTLAAVSEHDDEARRAAQLLYRMLSEAPA